MSLASGKVYGVITAMAVALVLVASIAYSQYLGSLSPNIQVSEKKEENLLSVSGVGKVYSKPDRGIVSIGVEMMEKEANDAMNKNTEIIVKVVETIKSVGVQDNEITTSKLSLNPVYDYSQKTPRLIGYKATNIVIVKTKLMDKLGEIIDKAVKAGANKVYNIGFTFSDEKAILLRNQAIKKAALDAKEKAMRLADTLGVKIVGIKNVSFLTYPTPVYRVEVKAAAGEVSVPVETGELELSVTISVNFIIKG